MNKLLIRIGRLSNTEAVYMLLGIFFISTIGVFMVQRYFHVIREKALLLVQEREAKKIQKENIAQYNELLNKPTRVATKGIEPARYVDAATGDLSIRYIFVKPNTIAVSAFQSLYDGLMQSIEHTPYSLHYLPIYLQEQAVRYHKSNVRLNQSFSDIYTLDTLEKVGNFANYWNKNPFGISILQDQFENVLKQHGENPDQHVVFLYFDNSFEIAQNDGDASSLYDYKKFRSFTTPEQKRSYINVYSFHPSMISTVTLIAAHEILHLYGASDKYNESTEVAPCSEVGRGNPKQIPVWPQATGDIMCLFVEKNERTFIRGSLNEKNLIINEITAKEIGW